MTTQYKILIVKNRYTGNLDFGKYLDWFKANTPVEIIKEEIATDFDVIPITIRNGTYGGVICDHTILDKLRPIIPENKYHAVVFVYGNDMGDIRVSCTNGEGGAYPLYQNTEFIQLVQLSDRGKTLNHELFHAFASKAKRRGAPVQDFMDTYLRDSDLSLTDGETNRTDELAQLQPYWNLITSLETTTTQPKYIHFTEKEVVGLKPGLVKILDQARTIANTPFVITSGYRTPAQNKAIGGVSNSAHIKGLAVDLNTIDNVRRMNILWGLMQFRKQLFIEICRSHIHVDTDSSIHALGQVMWSNDD